MSGRGSEARGNGSASESGMGTACGSEGSRSGRREEVIRSVYGDGHGNGIWSGPLGWMDGGMGWMD